VKRTIGDVVVSTKREGEKDDVTMMLAVSPSSTSETRESEDQVSER